MGPTSRSGFMANIQYITGDTHRVLINKRHTARDLVVQALCYFRLYDYDTLDRVKQFGCCDPRSVLREKERFLPPNDEFWMNTKYFGLAMPMVCCQSDSVPAYSNLVWLQLDVKATEAITSSRKRCRRCSSRNGTTRLPNDPAVELHLLLRYMPVDLLNLSILPANYHYLFLQLVNQIFASTFSTALLPDLANLCALGLHVVTGRHGNEFMAHTILRAHRKLLHPQLIEAEGSDDWSTSAAQVRVLDAYEANGYAVMHEGKALLMYIRRACQLLSDAPQYCLFRVHFDNPSTDSQPLYLGIGGCGLAVYSWPSGASEMQRAITLEWRHVALADFDRNGWLKVHLSDVGQTEGTLAASAGPLGAALAAAAVDARLDFALEPRWLASVAFNALAVTHCLSLAERRLVPGLLGRATLWPSRQHLACALHHQPFSLSPLRRALLLLADKPLLASLPILARLQCLDAAAGQALAKNVDDDTWLSNGGWEARWGWSWGVDGDEDEASVADSGVSGADEAVWRAAECGRARPRASAASAPGAWVRRVATCMGVDDAHPAVEARVLRRFLLARRKQMLRRLHCCQLELQSGANREAQITGRQPDDCSLYQFAFDDQSIDYRSPVDSDWTSASSAAYGLDRSLFQSPTSPPCSATFSIASDSSASGVHLSASDMQSPMESWMPSESLRSGDAALAKSTYAEGAPKSTVRTRLISRISALMRRPSQAAADESRRAPARAAPLSPVVPPPPWTFHASSASQSSLSPTAPLPHPPWLPNAAPFALPVALRNNPNSSAYLALPLSVDVLDSASNVADLASATSATGSETASTVSSVSAGRDLTPSKQSLAAGGRHSGKRCSYLITVDGNGVESGCLADAVLDGDSGAAVDDAEQRSSVSGGSGGAPGDAAPTPLMPLHPSRFGCKRLSRLDLPDEPLPDDVFAPLEHPV